MSAKNVSFFNGSPYLADPLYVELVGVIDRLSWEFVVVLKGSAPTLHTHLQFVKSYIWIFTQYRDCFRFCANLENYETHMTVYSLHPSGAPTITKPRL